MKAKVVVETMKDEDLSEVIRLGLSTTELHVEKDRHDYYSKDMLQGFIKSPNDIYLVAKIDGKIAGYRLATVNPFLREAYLIDLVVKSEFRGKGVASSLYKKTFQILNEKKILWAWTLVQEGNEKIEKILRKKGFKKGLKFSFFYKVRPF